MPPRQNRKERVKKYLPHHFRKEPLLKRFLTPFQAFPCIGDILKIKRNKTKPKFSFRIYKAKISSFHQPKRKKELMPNLPKPFCLRWACKQVGWTDAALSATCWSWFPASPSVQHGEACACGDIAGTRPISFAPRPKNYQFAETRAMARSSWSIPTAKGKRKEEKIIWNSMVGQLQTWNNKEKNKRNLRRWPDARILPWGAHSLG